MAKSSEQFEQIGEIHRKNMEAAMRLAQLSIDNSQRIMSLQTELAKSLFDDSVANAKALTTAREPQQAVALRTQYAQDTAQKMMEAARKIAEIGSDVRSEFSQLVTEQLASGSQEMADAFQAFFKAVPGQNPNVMDAFQHAMKMATDAFEQVTKVSGTALGNMTDAAKGSRKK
jgi:phasin family protein